MNPYLHRKRYLDLENLQIVASVPPLRRKLNGSKITYVNQITTQDKLLSMLLEPKINLRPPAAAMKVQVMTRTKTLRVSVPTYLPNKILWL